MKKLLLIAALIGAASASQARLGWTLEKCRKFYGEQVSEETAADRTKWHLFKVAGVQVILVFRESEASYIRYIFDPNLPTPTLHYLRDLLDKNSLGATWNYTSYPEYDGVDNWVQWNGYRQGQIAIVAQYKTRELIITTYGELLREQKRQSNPKL